MICIGIDPSSKRIAVAALADDGDIDHHVRRIAPNLRGAQRLTAIRGGLVRDLISRYDRPLVIVVEIPWANPKSGSSFVLMSIAGVLLEAAQNAHPDSVVIEMPTQVWKADSVGNGNASKAAVLEHAQALGMRGDDQDVADALCMAQAGWHAWGRHTEVAA